jgi:NAD(P)-dependent dehydrogenase (short-subunit alcohol dehydrogenase family)
VKVVPDTQQEGAVNYAREGGVVRDGLELAGQTLVVIGGSSGIGLETARLARDEGAEIIITARNADRVHRAGLELGASIAAFDATNFDRLERFFDKLPAPIDHVLVACPCPYCPRLADLDVEAARRTIETQLLLPVQVARNARGKLRPGGTLLFTGCTEDDRPAVGLSLVSGLSAALPALTKTLALEIAPVRVNLITAGFVDTPLSAALPGDRLETRREQLRTTLPVRRVVGPADIAAMAVYLMSNTAVTGATFEIDTGQQRVHT